MRYLHYLYYFVFTPVAAIMWRDELPTCGHGSNPVCSDGVVSCDTVCANRGSLCTCANWEENSTCGGSNQIPHRCNAALPTVVSNANLACVCEIRTTMHRTDTMTDLLTAYVIMMIAFSICCVTYYVGVRRTRRSRAKPKVGQGTYHRLSSGRL